VSKSRLRPFRSKKVLVYLFILVILLILTPVVIHALEVWFGKLEVWFGKPGSIKGGELGRLVDEGIWRRTLRLRLKHREKQLFDLHLQLPEACPTDNEWNLPQSTLEQILIRSEIRSNGHKLAFNRSTEWKEKGCTGRDSVIPDQILQPNFGSWFRPLFGRMDLKRLQFSEEESHALIKEYFPMIFPLYKRTLDPDERILIWSVCAMYQYGGYFLGNATRIVDSELSKINTKPSLPCHDFGIAFLSTTSLTFLAASPRHPQLAWAIQMMATWDQGIASFFNSVFENFKSTEEFRVHKESGPPENIPQTGRVAVTVSEVVDARKAVKTLKKPLSDQLVNAGCKAGWLCNRCLRLSFRGSYATCKSFCNSCFEKIICNKEETDAMNKITFKVTRKGPNTHAIPKIIHQTFSEELSTDRYLQLSRLQNTWKSSGWEYRFYDDNDVRNYLIKNFPARVMEAFDSVMQGAFRADLFRYLVLLKEGGIYVDIDVVLDTNLDLVIPPNLSFFAPVDIVTDYARTGSYCLWNGLLGSAPGHPLIAKAVEKSVTNILNRADYYDIERAVCHISGGSSEIWKLRFLPLLTITGPCLLGVAINEMLKRDPLENFEAGWISNLKDPGVFGDMLLLQASRDDMGAFRFTDVDRGIIVASTNMNGMVHMDKDAFDADAETPNEGRDEMTHYSKSEIGVDVFGSELVYIDKYVTNEVISLSFV